MSLTTEQVRKLEPGDKVVHSDGTLAEVHDKITDSQGKACFVVDAYHTDETRIMNDYQVRKQFVDIN